MSYDLVFWQQELKADLDPHATYVQLADGNRVDGLADIPLEDIFAGLREVFPTAVHELNGGGERLAWVSEDQRENFQAMWSVQHVLVNCTHLENDNMNAIITVLTSCACPLYDSLTGERFAFGGL